MRWLVRYILGLVMWWKDRSQSSRRQPRSAVAKLKRKRLSAALDFILLAQHAAAHWKVLRRCDFTAAPWLALCTGLHHSRSSRPHIAVRQMLNARDADVAPAILGQLRRSCSRASPICGPLRPDSARYSSEPSSGRGDWCEGMITVSVVTQLSEQPLTMR